MALAPKRPPINSTPNRSPVGTATAVNPPVKTDSEVKKPAPASRLAPKRVGPGPNVGMRRKPNRLGAKPQSVQPVNPAVAPPIIEATNAPSPVPVSENRLKELEKQVDQLLLTQNLTREFVSTTDMTKLLSVIFERVLETLNAEAGSFWIVDDKKEENICKLAEGPTANQVIGLRLPKGIGIVGSVINSRIPEIVTDVRNDERFSNTVDDKTGFITRSMICVPLTIDDQIYGAIQVLNRKDSIDGTFSEDDQQMIEDLAMSAAISIKNVRFLQTEQKVKEMNTLLSMSQQITSTLDIQHVLTSVTTLANELVTIEYCAIALLDENRDKLFMGAASEDKHNEWPEETTEALLNMMQKVREAGRSVYVAEREKYRKKVDDPENNIWLKFLDNQQADSLWMMPLKDDEGTLGVIAMVSKEAAFASGTKADILSILSNQTTISLRNASLYQKIPFAGALGRVGERSRAAFVSWRKWSVIILCLVMIGATLHYAPFFRSVTGNVIVEAKLGRGLFLPVSGVVKDMYVREGQRVKAGQLLFRLNDSDLRLSLIEAESKLAVLERQIIESRAKDDAAELSRHLIDRNSVRAQVIKARDDLRKVNVRAVRDAIILTPRTDELVGRNFSMGDEILRLADPEKPTVIVQLAEEDVLDVKVGHSVMAVLKARPGEYFSGKVAYIGRSFDVPTQALDQEAKSELEENEFIAELVIEQAPENLQPGMTGVARIDTPESSTLIRMARRVRNFFLFWFGV